MTKNLKISTSLLKEFNKTDKAMRITLFVFTIYGILLICIYSYLIIF